MEAVELRHVDAERLQPGQKTLQRREIGNLAAQQRLDGGYIGAEVLEIEQCLGRKNPGDTDLITG